MNSRSQLSSKGVERWVHVQMSVFRLVRTVLLTQTVLETGMRRTRL